MINRTFQFSVTLMLFSLLFTSVFFESSFANNIESPRKQLNHGVDPIDILCKPGFILVILHNDKPACLSPTTVLKLDERGYVQSVVREFAEEPVDIKDASSSINENTEPVDIKDASSSINENTEPIVQNPGTTISGNTGASSAPEIKNIPASQGSIVNFYIADDDLNTNRNGVDIIETEGLLEFLLNKIPIDGPDTMIETGPNTGQFFVRLQLPDTINGEPLSQDDVVEIIYFDDSDSSGEQRVSTKSIPLSQTYAQVQTSGGGKTRIGHDFTVRIYEPDANLDSKDVDRIPLSRIEYRGEGGIRTTLSNPAFDANGAFLRETDDNTGVFEVIIKIPRTIDGKTVHIGDWYELRYVDVSTPSNSSEEIKLKGRIG